MKSHKFKGENHVAFIHGHCSYGRKSKVYGIWGSIIQRTLNPNNPYYKNYGGRGINVCQEWRNPLTFIAWANKNGYRKGLEINRIDNDGDYKPDNCNFVDHFINNQNKRRRDDYGIDIWRGYYRVRITQYGKTICKYAKNIDTAREIKQKILT